MSRLDELLLKDFNTYSGNYEEGEEVVKLKLQYLDSAISVVESYLGYALREDTYEEDHVGTGMKKLYLYAMPITYVQSVTIDDVDLDLTEFNYAGDHITRIGKNKFFPKDSNITVVYTAGYNPYRLPDIIKQTILRIATLILTESGENIAVTSKSFPDNSRTFINYTNYSKYLEPLRKLRSFEI